MQCFDIRKCFGEDWAIVFGESVIVLLGVQYKDFRIGYSYDININKLDCLLSEERMKSC